MEFNPAHHGSITVPQNELRNLDIEFPLLVGGYGSGKTQGLIYNTLDDALNFGGVRIASYCPTYDLLKLNLIPRLEEILLLSNINYDLNKSDHIFTLENGSQIIMRSMDNPARIIAYEVFRSHIDEIDTIPSRDKANDIWRKIIARNRQKVYDENGKKLRNSIKTYTTPDFGFASFTYSKWGKGGDENYKYVRAPTYSNPFLDEDYTEKLRANYPIELCDAYIEGIWCNFTSGKVYRSYDRKRNRSTEEYKDGEIILVGQDFNVGKMATIVFVLRDRKWHAIDEKTDGYDTPDVIDWLNNKYREKGSRVIVYPDATGGSRNTTNASETDLTLFRAAGFKVVANASNPAIRDRVNAVNRCFQKLIVYVNDDKCPNLADSLEQQGWRNGQPDKTGDTDHPNDAFGYPIAYTFPIIKPFHNGMTEGMQ